MVNSLYEYYKTVFIVLDKDTKLNHREKLIEKLYHQIRASVQPKINTNAINKTIELFDRQIRFSLKEYFILHSVKVVNKYFLNTKGYHFFTLMTKKMLFKN